MVTRILIAIYPRQLLWNVISDYQVENVQMSSFSLQGTNSSSVTSGTNSSSVTSKYESRSFTIFEQIINAMEVYRSQKNMHCIPEKFYFFQQVSTPDKKNHPNLRKHGVSDRPGLGDLSDSSDTGNVQTFSRWDHLRGWSPGVIHISSWQPFEFLNIWEGTAVICALAQHFLMACCLDNSCWRSRTQFATLLDCYSRAEGKPSGRKIIMKRGWLLGLSRFWHLSW